MRSGRHLDHVCPRSDGELRTRRLPFKEIPEKCGGPGDRTDPCCNFSDLHIPILCSGVAFGSSG